MKYIKYGFGFLIVLVLVLVLIIRITMHESRPVIVQEADALKMADRMLNAVNIRAWDTLSYIKWTFRNDHHYVWDKVNNKALVMWDDVVVHLDPDQIKGKVVKNEIPINGDDAEKIIQTAWSYWCNDMFWLAAPFKIKDQGVTLNVAKDEDGLEGLLVSYASGGVTPGDSYLWFLDETGMPTGYKMWVKIIPVGGVYTSWENWIALAGGAKVAGFHQGKIDVLKIEISGILGGRNWEDIGYTENPILL